MGTGNFDQVLVNFQDQFVDMLGNEIGEETDLKNKVINICNFHPHCDASFCGDFFIFLYI